MISPTLQAALTESAKPFISGCISESHTKLRPWRVFLEIGSACNLHCPTCTKGNMEVTEGLKYEHQNGFMPMDLMEKILDKIKEENPNAIVFTYGNSEPFLRKDLPECITAIKKRGLHPEMSTNLNYINRVEELLEAGPDLIIISLSGFTQEVYVRGHAGGNIEKVKANMKILGDANNARPPEKRVNILVNYHVYTDNAHEVQLMNDYASSVGIGFFTSLARAISMENAIQYCRSKDPHATPFEVQNNKPDWNKILPPVSQGYIDAMERIRIKPTEAREMYKDIPETTLCPVGAGAMFTYIRHDGKTEMCSCVADRRITVGDYLTTTPDDMIRQRVNHSICKQCIKYKLNLYFMISDRDKWIP